MSVRVRVPASSANLGPGFDALGMGLALHAEIGVVTEDAQPGGSRVDEHHPASVAFRRAGGTGELWVRSPIPVGRGLGFSGAVRVGGIVAAHAQRHGADPDAFRREVPAMLAMASELEGHADNAAASLLGGVVATAAGRAVRVPVALAPAVVVWVPNFTTSTDESRTKLGAGVTFDDAVFNVGRTALLVAALAAGDVDALRSATEDRLHQDVRLAHAEPSRAALDAMLTAGVWAAWLSGSGPTVAGLCAPDAADEIAGCLPPDGRAMVLAIDPDGAVVVP
jgi:homoserine kinase